MDKVKAMASAHRYLVGALMVLLMLAPSLFYSAVLDDVFDEPRELVILALGGLAIVLIEARRAWAGRPILGGGERTWPRRLLLALVAWAGLSALFAVNGRVGWAYFASFGLVVAIALSIWGWLEQGPARRVPVLVGLATLVGLQTVVAIAQILRVPFGEWGAKTPALTLGGQVLPGGFWPYDFLTGLGFSSAAGLPIGTLGNANYLGELLCLALPVLAGWAIASSKPWGRWPLVVLCLPVVAVLLATSARAALLGLLIAAPVAAASVWGLEAFNLAKHWAHPGRRVWLGVSLALGLVVTGVAGERVAHKFQEQAKSDSSLENRLIYWQSGLDLVKEHPLVGVGIGNYKVVNFEKLRAQQPQGLPAMVSDSRFTRAHNEPLQLLIEQGAVGFLLVAAFLVAWWREVMRNPDVPTALKFGVLWGIGAVLIAGCFGFPLHVPVTAVAIAMVLVLGVARSAQPADAPLPSAWRWAYATASVLMLCSCVLLAGQKYFVPQFEAHKQLLAARILFVNGRQAESAVVYRSVDRTARYLGVYRVEVLRALVHTGQYDEALRLYDDSAREGLGLEAVYWKARALWGLGRIQEAQSAYTELTRFFTSNHRLHIDAQHDMKAISQGLKLSKAGG